jgi:transcriptional regulator with XRE-family HTH domain
MAKVAMDANGRFGQIFVAAVNEKGVSLRQVAAKLDYSYEHMRKLVQGKSWPPPEVLGIICKYLDIDLEEAQSACTADRMERTYGTDEAYKALGKDPRLSDIEPYLSRLSPQEWNMFVTQIAGYVRERERDVRKVR